jgi:prolyl-tRNA synthetase
MDADGQSRPVFMGSYGIGVPRLMGAVVEALSDEHGIIWPKTIAPFDIHLVLINGTEETKARAESIYQALTQARGGAENVNQRAKLEVLYDDREARAGEKFSDADLIGIPLRVVVSDKNQQTESGEYLLEVKDRETGKVENITLGQLVEWFG